MKNDVTLLADIFENVIDICIEYYDLDPCLYFSAPGLSWHAMLRMTNIRLEKIKDPDMHLFIEKAMRGGICFVAKRYSKANIKGRADYDPSKPEKYIENIDVNDL